MPTVLVNGIQLYYTLQGEGEPLALVHSPALSGAIFNRQVRELSRRYKVLTFDIRGHGLSGRSPTPWGFQDIAADLRKLLDYLNIRETFLCGFSAGNSIVLEFMLRYPESAKGAVLIGAISEVRDPLLKAIVRTCLMTSKVKGAPILGFLASLANSESVKDFTRMFRPARMPVSRDALQFYRAYLNYNCTRDLPRIEQPVLLVYGEKDRIFHKYGIRLHQQMKNNKLHFIPKAGHEIPVKYGTALNACIEQFIEDHRLDPSIVEDPNDERVLTNTFPISELAEFIDAENDLRP